MTQFPQLFQPLTLKHHTLKNRIIMGSMHTNLEESPQGFAALAEFYRHRAENDVALIVTGGISPNASGVLAPKQAMMTSQADVAQHKQITQVVHNAGGKICMQLLHAGRYGFHPDVVAPSAIQAPISPFKPKELTDKEIEQQITDFINAAVLADQAGYDGVEIMGSEGYLINQFIAKRTNHRADTWGGSLENRCRFALEIVKGIRAKLGDKFLILFRLSVLDLVEQGSDKTEVLQLAKWLEDAGVDIINTGIGWHEARVPTIAAMVPNAVFSQASQLIKQHVDIPVVAVNRINMPETAEQILKDSHADLISMARPFLADSAWVKKAQSGKVDEINTCIACNQACLDKVFLGQTASCLVNPVACRETELKFNPAAVVKNIAVIGAGVAGMAAAVYCAMRGHQVSLFEKRSEIGGQVNFAKNIPGKSEFAQLLRYFKTMLAKHAVDIRLNIEVEPDDLANFDEVIVASGVQPRYPDIAGLDDFIGTKVFDYQQVLSGNASLMGATAIVGAGGIGVDMAVFLTEQLSLDDNSGKSDAELYCQQWGIDLTLEHEAGLTQPQVSANSDIYLLQRKAESIGKNLAKTTGWIHKAHLQQHKVHMLSGVSYQEINQQGLVIEHDGQTRLLEVNNIVVCSGQESVIPPWIVQLKQNVHFIGGAAKAAELDAERAIYQAAKIANVI